MLKLDLLVPAILIVCLIALAYILSKVFSPAEQNPTRGAQTEILLDPERYQGGRTADNDDIGEATNISEGGDRQPANVSNDPNGVNSDLDKYYQDGSVGEVTGNEPKKENANDEDKYYNEEDAPSPSTSTTVQRPARPATEDATTTTATKRDIRKGEYHVIAGSFRQEVFAQQRVKELKRDGFSSAYVGYTNRGAYAVAVAGSSSSLSSARDISSRVRQKGYDNFVKRGE